MFIGLYYIGSLAKFTWAPLGFIALHASQCSLHINKPQTNEIYSLSVYVHSVVYETASSRWHWYKLSWLTRSIIIYNKKCQKTMKHDLRNSTDQAQVIYGQYWSSEMSWTVRLRIIYSKTIGNDQVQIQSNPTFHPKQTWEKQANTHARTHRDKCSRKTRTAHRMISSFPSRWSFKYKIKQNKTRSRMGSYYSGNHTV